MQEDALMHSYVAADIFRASQIATRNDTCAILRCTADIYGHSSARHIHDFWNFRNAALQSLTSSYSYHVFMNTVYLLSTVNGYSYYLISKICISYAQ